ncbi:alpha beta-hydrolase [Neoconidiobolus thromboides FSU 785]|nr:alpha beta-hydrolase [Neoconidiobolus thromboides FSU 785]
MTFNAYITPSNPNWLDLGNDVKEREPFGWEEGENGLRGYVFANKDNSSIIVSFKGTSAGLVGGDSKTSGKDKLNDNLLFSCCCARVDQTWYKVCDCFEGGNKCNGQCLEKSLAANNTDIYYFAAQKILRKIEDMYQGADIWLTGHSLGGGLAALLGLTYNLPTVTFQAPGDKRAFERLQLPGIPAIDPEEAHIWHFGHNTDPIYMGECQGVLSACYIGGYAMESKCHTGKICVYDTKKERDWSMDILKHRIGVVIEEVINYFDDVPECKLENPECKDCISWLY